MVREYISFSGSDDDFDSFLTEFQQESDRAAAVLGTALADELLKSLLKKSFVSGSDSERLLATSGPLGTFSARISLAHAIGLISNDESNDLHRLRNIRNKFAHRLHGLSFLSQSINDMSFEFRCVAMIFAIDSTMQSEYPRHPRKLFNLATALLCHRLNKKILNASPIPTPP